jgi:hypothetical protein
MTMKELCSKRSVVANFSALEVRTSTASKMFVEAVECLGIDIRQAAAFSFNEAADMSGGTNVSNGAAGRIPCAF